MHSFWFTGPEFLKNPDSTDSSSEIIDVKVFDIDENDPEVRTQITTYVTGHSKAQGLGSSRFERFSEWSSLRRAISNLTIRIKSRKTDDHHLLTLEEKSQLSKQPTPRRLPRCPTAAELKHEETVMILTAQM
jgi:hypothetical protein